MKLKDKNQKVEVCETLIKWGVESRPVDELFEDFPTPIAYYCLKKSSPLNPVETTVVRVMLSVWSNADMATVMDIFRLDPERRLLLFGLLAAVAESHEAVDAWLEKYAVKGLSNSQPNQLVKGGTNVPT